MNKIHKIGIFFFLFSFFQGFTACLSGQNIEIPVGLKHPLGKESLANFAEGCFWHTEIIFQSLVGVREVTSGYAGGKTPNPSYAKVASGSSGYAETVQIYYDSSKISFKELVNAFFASHDPTTLNRQGNDIGPQYRSIAFYRNEKEKKMIEEEIKVLNDSKKYKNKIVTEVLPLRKFYPAEEYHQEFIFKHPDNVYVKKVSIPDFIEFKKTFHGKFKKQL